VIASLESTRRGNASCRFFCPDVGIDSLELQCFQSETNRLHIHREPVMCRGGHIETNVTRTGHQAAQNAL
jgi:hypothetical protein